MHLPFYLARFHYSYPIDHQNPSVLVAGERPEDTHTQAVRHH